MVKSLLELLTRSAGDVRCYATSHAEERSCTTEFRYQVNTEIDHLLRTICLSNSKSAYEYEQTGPSYLSSRR